MKGYYIRRLIINFDKLTFSEVTGVFLAFKRYYEIWQMSFNTQNDINKEINNVLYSDNWFSDRDQWSQRQAALFIATQAALLTNNEEKALDPAELQKRITDLLKSNSSLSEAHFLSYLNYLRIHEFCGAIDSLYHYFDRRTIVDIKGPNDEKSKVYRFAALNLAILHFHFGHRDEALASLKEAIKISQAANDNICLQHALSWLYRLTNINKTKLIEHSIMKGLGLNLSDIISLGLQTLVQHARLYSCSPLQLFETLTRSDSINNCQNNHQDLITNSYALKSCLWQFYGKPEMSSLWSQLLFYLNIDNPNTSKTCIGEGFCLALCNISNHLLFQGDYPLVNAIIHLAKDRFPHEPISHILMLCENLFIFVRSLHHENWQVAESAAQKIMVVNKWEGCLRLAELYLNKQDYPEAHKCISIVMDMYESDDQNKNEIHYYIRAKILLAEVQFATSCSDAVPAGIMTLLSNCLIDTNKYYMEYHSALVHLHIANVQLSLGLFGQALKVLDRCLVQILAHGGYFDRARAVLLYVKCFIANSYQLNNKERKEVILKAIQMLDKVKDNFKKVEAFSRVKDVLYFQAKLYNSINMKNERNRCSAEYRLLSEEYTTKNYNTLINFL